MPELDELRQRVQALDHAILGAISARLDAVRRIGEIKKRDGIPLRDWQRERDVIEQAERTATALGVSADLAREVLRSVIQESCTIQEQQSYSTYTGEAEQIAVIGGAGKMGRWLVEFFGNQGHAVRVCDSAGTDDQIRLGWKPIPQSDGVRDSLDQALDGADFAIIATPLSIVPHIIEQLAQCRYPGIACDIASLKSQLEPAIHSARAVGLRYTSMHPMFGPATRTLSDQVICLCDCGDADATERIRRFFADTAATLVDLSLEDHDRIVSHVLGLSHLANLVFASSLADSGFSFEQFNRIGSTTFHSQMRTTAAVIHENPELYYEIQSLNRFTSDVNQRLAEKLAEWTDAIARGDHDAFVREMLAARTWIDADDAN